MTYLMCQMYNDVLCNSEVFRHALYVGVYRHTLYV